MGSENIPCGLEDLFFLPCLHSKICGSKRMNTTSLAPVLSTENASRRSKLIETPVFQRMDEFSGFPNTLFTFPEVAFKEFSSGLRKSLEFVFGGPIQESSHPFFTSFHPALTLFSSDT